MTAGGEILRIVVVPEKSHPYDPWSEAVAACAEGGGKIGYFGRLAAGKYRPLILSVRERARACETRTRGGGNGRMPRVRVMAPKPLRYPPGVSVYHSTPSCRRLAKVDADRLRYGTGGKKPCRSRLTDV